MWAVGAASGRDSGGGGSRGYPASRRGTEEGSVGQTVGGQERRFRDRAEAGESRLQLKVPANRF